MQISTTHPLCLTDRALTLGEGVFDTTLAVFGQVLEASLHCERLWQSCCEFGFSIERDELASKYKLIPDNSRLSTLRITVTGGPGERGLSVPLHRKSNLLVQRSAWSTNMMFTPVTLQLSNIRRNETSPLSRHKTISYLDCICALSNAKTAGADDALFLNSHNHVSCTTMANLFIIDNHNRLLTPSLDVGILDGVTRARVIALATEMGIDCIEAKFCMDIFTEAAGVFTTNSLRLMCPVTQLGQYRFKTESHPIFKTLKAQLIMFTGLNDFYDGGTGDISAKTTSPARLKHITPEQKEKAG